MARKNTSGFRGVHFDKFSGKWMARYGREQKYLGRYTEIIDAAAAYMEYAIKELTKKGRLENEEDSLHPVE